MVKKETAEKAVREIRRKARRRFPAESVTWFDRTQPVPDAVREVWMDDVAGSGMFEIPRADGKLGDVVPLREPGGEPQKRCC
jgi:hypothetical protein